VKEGNQKLVCPISLPSFFLFLASSTSIFGAPKLSNSAPLIFGKQDHPILCAIFSSQGFGAPSPPLHAYLPRPLCLFLFGFTWFPQHSLRVCTLIHLYICWLIVLILALKWSLPTAPQTPTACRLCPLAIALSKLLWLHRWLQVTLVGMVRTRKTLITVFSLSALIHNPFH
jgi:hypothetical protein